MKQFLLIFFAFFIFFPQTTFAQIPTNTLVKIVKAEDARRWNSTLENLLKNSDAVIRERAALAAGRIGDERAVTPLINLLQDSSINVQTMGMFALGEIESSKASDAVINVLKSPEHSEAVRARALEAAGKIAAASPKEAKTSELKKALSDVMIYEIGKQLNAKNEAVLLGITAILRARPEGGERLLTLCLNFKDARIRADALNALARLRSKNIDKKTLETLLDDSDPVVRANAARLFGIPEYDFNSEYLLERAMFDKDERVRVNAIRALASLDKSSADKLIVRTQTLWAEYQNSRKRFQNPKAKNEMLEIATTLGRLLANTNLREAIDFLNKFNEADNYESPEIQIALVRIAPAKFSEFQRKRKGNLKPGWKSISAMMQGAAELANAPDNAETKTVKDFTKAQILVHIRSQLLVNQREDKILSDALAAYAAFKPTDLTQILLDAMKHPDTVVRAATAGLLANTKSSREAIETLKKAFVKSLLTDKRENDAQLAILDALYKLDKKESVSSLLLALEAPDYLVRQKAIQLIKTGDFIKDVPEISSMLARAKTTVEPYAAYTGTKLGQIFYTNADYSRAVSRKNGTVKAVFTTSKGNFTIDFFPEDAPLAVDNFIKLARANYFNGLAVHRVVPNFVMQDGDPRGDGSGGPGHQIRCEINTLDYERGTVGMALSGKDTGGSQWFVTHSPQPHLDGGYTVFGKVNETDMKIVDSIVRGDKILSVRIIEGNTPRKSSRRRN